MSSQCLNKDVRNDVDFLHADKHQNFLEFDFNTWASKFPTRWDYHYWRAWPSILKVLKVASLRYLYNIFKTNFGMELIFCIRINKVSRSWHYSFWSKWSNYQVVKGDRELFFSSEFMSSGLEWTTFERNCFTASLKFDSKYKTFEAKIIQEP